MGKYLYVAISCLIFINCTKLCAQANAAYATSAIESDIDSLNSRGYRLIRNDATRALLMFMQAEHMAAKYQYNEGLAAAYVNEAEVFDQRGYLKRALVFYYQALNISRKSNDAYHMAQCEQHISTIKRKSGEYDEARRLLAHALGVFEKLDKPVDIVNIKLRQGLLAVAEKRYSDASRIYNAAYQNSLSAKYQFGEKKSYYNKGLMYEAIDQPDSAIRYFNLALKIDTATHDKFGKALSYIELGRIYTQQHALALAGNFSRQAFFNADSVSANDLVFTAAGLMLGVVKAQHNVPSIIEWQDKLLAINDKVTKQRAKDASTFIDILKEQQETQDKYLEQIDVIEKVSKQKTIWIIGCLAILAALVVAGLSINSNYRKTKTFANALKVINKKIEEKSKAVTELNSQILTQNASLERDNNLKNKLLSVISHDLRHPLVNTQSLLRLYNDDILSEEEAKHLFLQLEGQYVRTITLLDNLLFWIKRQVQHIQADKSHNDISRLIQNIIDEQKIAISNKQMTVSNNINPGVSWCADREGLRVVFRNLLSNALKFTPERGTIAFTSVCSGSSTSITVTDSGIGMGEAKLQKVLEGNYFTSSGTAGEVGSGFGLILVRDLIANDGGQLSVSSTAGAGTAFTVTFPKHQVELNVAV